MGQQEKNEKLENLEMAKKRNHKILITDEAINKVPKIQYKGIPENEYNTIQELAKNVLRISKEENDSNEVAITYSMNNETKDLKGLQKAADYFLKNCHSVGIEYNDR